MEVKFLTLFPFVATILSVKFQKLAHFILFIYLATLKKLKPKYFTLQQISYEKFEDLALHNSYKFDFFGDLYSCALISINTLVSLSATNKSWFKISKLNINSDVKKENTADGKFLWKIAIPPVEVQEKTDSNNYYIQCLCVSNVLKDFVLYVTDIKLFNINNYLNSENFICDENNLVEIKYDVEFNYPSVAKSAVVSAVITENDISFKVLEVILHEYFKTVKLLRVGEVIHINLFRTGYQLKTGTNHYNASDVYFKVISLKGQSNAQEYFIIKGYTDLYLNPGVHSYLPPKYLQYIKAPDGVPGYDIPCCPDGLLSYFDKLKKIFKLIIKADNFKKIIFLSGARGSGKKTTLKSVTNFFGFNFLCVNCFDFYGVNASLFQKKFDLLGLKARTCVPCVICLENIELLGREQNYLENARLIDIFETQLREIWLRKSSSYPLLIFGLTHLKPSELVPAIARLSIQTIFFEALKPDETYLTLKWILKSSNMICCSGDLRRVAEKIRGYYYSDLVLLTQLAIHTQSLESDSINESRRILLLKHFVKGIELMEAAYSDCIGAARVPTVHWDDVGGLADLKEEIMMTLSLPVQHPELFNSGLKRSGILFYGPPGTGKTLMAKAIATECSYNFLSVKGPELMNMYVGQSEKNVREVFDRAREASPCIIFFDELDSLAPSRGISGDSGGVTDRVVSQLLAEMDGLDKNRDIFVIAATNRPDLIDVALLRPGRFDKMFYVGVCADSDSKLSVLKALVRKFNLGPDVNFQKIIQTLPAQVTGADLYSVCSSAWFAAARRAVHAIENGAKISLPLEVVLEDFYEAVAQFVPSLTSDDIKYYENLKSS